MNDAPTRKLAYYLFPSSDIVIGFLSFEAKSKYISRCWNSPYDCIFLNDVQTFAWFVHVHLNTQQVEFRFIVNQISPDLLSFCPHQQRIEGYGSSILVYHYKYLKNRLHKQLV